MSLPAVLVRVRLPALAEQEVKEARRGRRVEAARCEGQGCVCC